MTHKHNPSPPAHGGFFALQNFPLRTFLFQSPFTNIKKKYLTGYFLERENTTVLKCFRVLFHCFYRKLFFIFSISQKKLFECISCNVCFFIAFYIAFSDAKKAVKNLISTARSNPHETCDESEEVNKGNIF